MNAHASLDEREQHHRAACAEASLLRTASYVSCGEHGFMTAPRSRPGVVTNTLSPPPPHEHEGSGPMKITNTIHVDDATLSELRAYARRRNVKLSTPSATRSRRECSASRVQASPRKEAAKRLLNDRESLVPRTPRRGHRGSAGERASCMKGSGWPASGSRSVLYSRDTCARRAARSSDRVDVAQKEDGSWLVMELNDGGSAGVPEGGNVTEFYLRLAESVAAS